MFEWYLDKNNDRITDLVFDELIIKKSGLGWWRRFWNTEKDLEWVEERKTELLNKEFDASRGN